MNSPHTTTELLSEMIGLIYEAAADLSLWPQLLESMSAYLELSLPGMASASAPNLPISPAERSLINFLAPHFERAQAIHQQLAEVVEERNLLESLMNRLPMGAVIIDTQCNAISLNRTIISLLQGSELLQLQAGRLVSNPPHLLEQAVEKIISGELPDEVIRLGDEGTSLSLWISRGGFAPPTDAGLSRLTILVASRSSHALSEQGLISFFGLTPAEARVTQKFALGSPLEECAELLQISKATVRTHLKHVFSKVGVKRQSELMQAIYASPLWLQVTPLLPDSGASNNIPLAVLPATEAQKLRLADGRWLYFSDSGDTQGHPVILMHGIAGSRYLRHPDDDILMQEGIRLIIPERPGSGDSDPKAGRTIADWTQDIIALVNHLDLKRFSVLGYSAGTPYALAVAEALPERVQNIRIIAAMPPIDDIEDLRAYNTVFRMTLLIAKYTPGLLPALMRVMVKDIRKNVYQYMERMLVGAPEQDREILSNARLRVCIANGMRASVRNGEHEVAQEVLLAAKDWSLDMRKIVMPVEIWHGEQDPLVSSSGAYKLAGLLPNARVVLIPHAGHYLLYSHWQELLRSIRCSI